MHIHCITQLWYVKLRDHIQHVPTRSSALLTFSAKSVYQYVCTQFTSVTPHIIGQPILSLHVMWSRWSLWSALGTQVEITKLYFKTNRICELKATEFADPFQFIISTNTEFILINNFMDWAIRSVPNSGWNLSFQSFLGLPTFHCLVVSNINIYVEFGPGSIFKHYHTDCGYSIGDENINSGFVNFAWYNLTFHIRKEHFLQNF
jgi:hypothetical protein